MDTQKLKSMSTLESTLESIKDKLKENNVPFQDVNLSFEIDRNKRHYQQHYEDVSIKYGIGFDIEFINSTKNTLTVEGIEYDRVGSIEKYIKPIIKICKQLRNSLVTENNIMELTFDYAENTIEGLEYLNKCLNEIDRETKENRSIK